MLIAGGLVYVIQGGTLYALDARTGSRVWSASVGDSLAEHTYGAGRVFVVNGAGTVLAFDGATGALAWTQSMVRPNLTSFATVPTAYAGILYTEAAGTGGTLFAYDEASGDPVFQVYSPYADDGSPPALADDGLTVAFECKDTYKYDRLTGAPIWQYTTDCGGAGADVAVLRGGQTYVTQSPTGTILDSSTGAAAGTYNADHTPAFDDRFGVFSAGPQLTAIDLGSGQTAWTVAQNAGSYFVTAPLLAGGLVFTIDIGGELRAFDESTGDLLWSDSATLATPSEGPVAMAAASDLLVIPESGMLVAYRSSADAGAVPGADGASGDGGCGDAGARYLKSGVQLATTPIRLVGLKLMTINRQRT